MEMSDFMKFIDAPWKIESPIGAEHPQIRDKTGRRIAIVAATWPQSTRTEDKNASLMCAAPEMYLALKNLLSRISYDSEAKYWFLEEQNAAYNAIARADGKPIVEEE